MFPLAHPVLLTMTNKATVYTIGVFRQSCIFHFVCKIYLHIPPFYFHFSTLQSALLYSAHTIFEMTDCLVVVVVLFVCVWSVFYHRIYSSLANCSLKLSYFIFSASTHNLSYATLFLSLTQKQFILWNYNGDFVSETAHMTSNKVMTVWCCILQFNKCRHHTV